MGGENIKYSFKPVVAAGCRVLVLGSLPGDASLQAAEYYAHPRNAFWGVIGRLCGFAPQLPYEERLARLTAAGVGLWDVVGAGVRPGSLDADIREVQPNDIPALLREYPDLCMICCNGGTAHRYLKRYYPALFCRAGLQVVPLPSTSPAAARLSFEAKYLAYESAIAPLLRRQA